MDGWMDGCKSYSDDCLQQSARQVESGFRNNSKHLKMVNKLIAFL
jgi:hypothetical protein